MSTETIQIKAKTVDQIKAQVAEASTVIFANFRGLSVSEITTLRAELRQNGANAHVYKNTLSQRALNELNITVPDSILFGPTLMIYTSGDVVNAAKVATNFSKANECLVIKGGLLDNASITDAEIKNLALLPSRDELIAKVVGGIKAPISGLVMALSSPIRGLVLVLNSIKDKKQEDK